MESRFGLFGLVVLAKMRECEAELIRESTSKIAVFGSGQRHGRASSGNCCSGSRDGEWLRKNQLVDSEGLVARS